MAIRNANHSEIQNVIALLNLDGKIIKSVENSGAGAAGVPR